MTDELAPIEGKVIDNVTTRIAWPGPDGDVLKPKYTTARLGIGGPINGKVISSSSARLQYREPTITIQEDIFTGQRDTHVDVAPKVTYLAESVFICDREYRIWIPERVWHEADMEDIQAEVTLVLIDAEPRLTEVCFQ